MTSLCDVTGTPFPDTHLLAFLPVHSSQFDDVIESILAPLIAKSDWRSLARLLQNTCHVLLTCRKPRVVFLKDCAIRDVICGYTAAMRKGVVSPQTSGVRLTRKDVWRLLLNMTSSRERHRLMFKCLHLFSDVVTCVKHLQEYLLAIDDGDVTKEVVEEKLKIMQIFLQVRAHMHVHVRLTS